MKPYYDEAGVTIYNADCREVVDEWDQADVMVTDPPYGLGFPIGRQHKGKWSSRWSGVSIVGDADTTVRDEVLAVWAPRPALVFGTWKRPLPAGVCEVLVWDKVVSTGIGDLSIPWRPSWESIYVIGGGGSADAPTVCSGTACRRWPRIGGITRHRSRSTSSGSSWGSARRV